MKLGPFQEVILESSSVEELKEKVRLSLDKRFHSVLQWCGIEIILHTHCSKQHSFSCGLCVYSVCSSVK